VLFVFKRQQNPAIFPPVVINGWLQITYFLIILL